jgi:hypothetical protein
MGNYLRCGTPHKSFQSSVRITHTKWVTESSKDMIRVVNEVHFRLGLGVESSPAYVQEVHITGMTKPVYWQYLLDIIIFLCKVHFMWDRTSSKRWCGVIDIGTQCVFVTTVWSTLVECIPSWIDCISSWTYSIGLYLCLRQRFLHVTKDMYRHLSGAGHLSVFCGSTWLTGTAAAINNNEHHVNTNLCNP